jgi:hypothetical protein
MDAIDSDSPGEAIIAAVLSNPGLEIVTLGPLTNWRWH